MRALVLTALVACQQSSAPQKKEAPAPAAAPAPAPAPVAAPAMSLAQAQNRFALELWSQLPSGNVAMSPPIVTAGLAMAWAGAKSTTADEMRKVLHFDGREDAVISRWGQVYQALKLDGALRMFADQHQELDPIFFDVNMQAFGTRTDAMDFQTDAEGTRTKINTWVGKQAKIADMLPPGAVNAATQLVLVGAVTMALTPPSQPTYRYAHAGGAALLEVPLPGGRSMYVLLPDAADGLAPLETKLADSLRGLQTRLAEEQVHVELPRFTVDAGTMDLAKALQALGMKAAFDVGASFGGIAKTPLHLLAVFHRAIVSTEELRTKTGKVDFIANRPFLFVVVDHASGLIVMMGRVASRS